MPHPRIQDQIKEELDELREKGVDVQPWMRRLIGAIIRLRRNQNPDQAWAKVQRVTENRIRELPNIGHRWLNSISDSYLDHRTNEEKLSFMGISTFYALSRLLQFSVNQSKITEKSHERSGDKGRNLLKRVENIDLHPVARVIWNKIVDDIKNQRINQFNVVFNHLGWGWILTIQEYKERPNCKFWNSGEPDF